MIDLNVYIWNEILIESKVFLIFESDVEIKDWRNTSLKLLSIPSSTVFFFKFENQFYKKYSRIDAC